MTTTSKLSSGAAVCVEPEKAFRGPQRQDVTLDTDDRLCDVAPLPEPDTHLTLPYAYADLLEDFRQCVNRCACSPEIPDNLAAADLSAGTANSNSRRIFSLIISQAPGLHKLFSQAFGAAPVILRRNRHARRCAAAFSIRSAFPGISRSGRLVSGLAEFSFKSLFVSGHFNRATDPLAARFASAP